MQVCPVGATFVSPDGVVLVDKNYCLGCRYCIQACPFSVPRYEWNSLVPRVRKCTFCADRLAAGGINACAEACPAGATVAGEREALLREARARLAAEPDKYVPKIYGEHDAGGTSVLMLCTSLLTRPLRCISAWIRWLISARERLSGETTSVLSGDFA